MGALELRPGLWRWTAPCRISATGCGLYPSPTLPDPDELRPLLTTLTELPVELILLAHGPPVLEDARLGLAQAVAPRAA